MILAFVLAALSCGLVASWGEARDAGQAPAPSTPRTVDYERDVRPILASRCFNCHGPRQQQSGLRLDLRQNALRGGDYGVVIVPGKSAESKLIRRLVGPDAGLQMPPTGELPPNEIEILRAWIDSGAEMPGRASEVTVVKRETDPTVHVFLDAIARHDLAAVQTSLATNNELAHSTDTSGSTALMHAAAMGTVLIMQALLDAGADVNTANMRQATALHWATADAAKVKLLLTYGAWVDARTVEGRTPLYVVATQPAGAPIVKLLLEADADVDAKTLVGTTPLFPAVIASAETTKLLLDKGANPNARSLAGATPIMFTRGADVVALLIARGADVDARSKAGETALMDAATRGDVVAATMILDEGSDVNATDHRGYTALMFAAQYDGDAPDLVWLLLDRGATASATAEGETALSLAAKRGETPVTMMLRDADAAARKAGSRQ